MQLVPMSEEEYNDYLIRLIPEFAADGVRGEIWSADEAEASAGAEIRGMLPGGFDTLDHYFYTLRVEEEAAPVGAAWFGVLRRGLFAPRGFIYDLWIYRAYRGRRYGDLAMREIKAKAQEMGLKNVGMRPIKHGGA